MPTKGIQGATAERIELAARVRVLYDEGLVQREIAAKLGLSRSYTSALLCDPDGAKARARKDRYAGECVECGAATSGSDGADSAPERCGPCQLAKQHDERYWTRERIIDAIQRFAAENGRPPLADEWIRSNPEKDYPPRTSVYRAGRRHQLNPFASWADAIEAAGFPRPYTGVKYAIPRPVTCPRCDETTERVASKSVALCDDCEPEHRREYSRDYYQRRKREKATA